MSDQELFDLWIERAFVDIAAIKLVDGSCISLDETMREVVAKVIAAVMSARLKDKKRHFNL